MVISSESRSYVEFSEIRAISIVRRSRQTNSFHPDRCRRTQGLKSNQTHHPQKLLVRAGWINRGYATGAASVQRALHTCASTRAICVLQTGHTSQQSSLILLPTAGDVTSRESSGIPLRSSKPFAAL